MENCEKGSQCECTGEANSTRASGSQEPDGEIAGSRKRLRDTWLWRVVEEEVVSTVKATYLPTYLHGPASQLGVDR